MSNTTKGAIATLKRTFSASTSSSDEPSPFLPAKRQSPQVDLRNHLNDNPHQDKPRQLIGDFLRDLRDHVKVLQWNICGNAHRQNELLEDAAREKGGGWHFIALQEASKNSQNIRSNLYDAVELSSASDGTQPIWWYVQKDVGRNNWRVADNSCNCKHKEEHDRYMSTLVVKSDIGVDIYITNVYNRNKQLPPACIAARTKGRGLHLQVGDYNLHTWTWGGPGMTQRCDEKGARLQDEMYHADMKLLTTAANGGTFSRPQYGSGYRDIIDLAWMSRHHMNRMRFHRPRPDLKGPKSDHTPFETGIDLTIVTEEKDKKLWEEADEGEVNAACQTHLPSTDQLPSVGEPRSIEDYAKVITQAVQAANAAVPSEKQQAAPPKVGPEATDARTTYKQAGEAFRTAEKVFVRDHAPHLDLHTDTRGSCSDDTGTGMYHSSDNLEGVSSSFVPAAWPDEDHCSCHDQDSDWNSFSRFVRGRSHRMDHYSDANDVNWDSDSDSDATSDDPYSFSDSEDDDEYEHPPDRDEEFDDEGACQHDGEQGVFDADGYHVPGMEHWTPYMREQFRRIRTAYRARDELRARQKKFEESEKNYQHLKATDALRQKRQRLGNVKGSSIHRAWGAIKRGGEATTPAVFQEVLKDGKPSQDSDVIANRVLDTWVPRWKEPFEHRAIAERETPQDCKGRTVNEKQLRRLLRLLKNRIAPGKDDIPNEILKLCEDILVPHLVHLFNACFRIGYFPKVWRIEKMIALKKKTPRNFSYGDPGDWRPISLLSCLGKLMESYIAMVLTEIALELELVPKTQFGTSRRSTITALIYLIEIIRAAWRRGKAVTILSLDLSGAFPRTDRALLLDLLVSNGVPIWIVNILGSFFTERQAFLSLPGHESGPHPLNCGIPQGSPLSPILFAIFSSGLLALDKSKYGKPEDGVEDIFMFSYVDDTYMIAVSDSWDRNNELLQHAHAHPLDWARTHKAAFNPEKYQVLHLTQSTHHMHKVPETIPRIDGLTVDQEKGEAYNSPMKIVGVTITSTLRWDEHVERMRAKAAQLRNRFSQLASSTWGPDMLTLRMLVRSSMYELIMRHTLTSYLHLLVPHEYTISLHLRCSCVVCRRPLPRYATLRTDKDITGASRTTTKSIPQDHCWRFHGDAHRCHSERALRREPPGIHGAPRELDASAHVRHRGMGHHRRSKGGCGQIERWHIAATSESRSATRQEGGGCATQSFWSRWSWKPQRCHDQATDQHGNHCRLRRANASGVFGIHKREEGHVRKYSSSGSP